MLNVFEVDSILERFSFYFFFLGITSTIEENELNLQFAHQIHNSYASICGFSREIGFYLEKERNREINRPRNQESEICDGVFFFLIPLIVGKIAAFSLVWQSDEFGSFLGEFSANSLNCYRNIIQSFEFISHIARGSESTDSKRFVVSNYKIHKVMLKIHEETNKQKTNTVEYENSVFMIRNLRTDNFGGLLKMLICRFFA